MARAMVSAKRTKAETPIHLLFRRRAQRSRKGRRTVKNPANCVEREKRDLSLIWWDWKRTIRPTSVFSPFRDARASAFRGKRRKAWRKA